MDSLEFLEQSGWGGAARAPLAGDASARRYYRVQRGGETAVLMIAPVATDADRRSFQAFLRVAAWLGDQGLAAPEIYASDDQSGFVLMQDFGDLSLARLLDKGQAFDAYMCAAAIPDHLAECPVPAWLACPDVDAQADMVAITFEHLPGSAALAADMRGHLRAALAGLPKPSPVFALRDFHADNLLWRPAKEGLNRVGLLDFQDAVALPPGYDLASLVDDPRRDVPADLRAALVARFAGSNELNPEEAQLQVDTLSMLRNLRILGIFRRLGLTGKPGYQRFLPRTMRLIRQACTNPCLLPLQGPVAATLDLTGAWTAGEPE